MFWTQMRHPLGLCFAAMLLASSACAEQLTRAERDLFENHARPLLVSHCIQCHGAKEQEGGLRLTSREHILSGCLLYTSPSPRDS